MTGCGTKESPLTLEDRIEKLMFSPYTAGCTATVKTPLTENSYTYVCKKEENGRYTVNYEGMTLTVDDYDAVISKDGSEIKTRITDDEMALLPTYFFMEYLGNGEVVPLENGYLLKSEINSANPYRCTAEMYLNKDLVPEKMNIKDKDGKTTAEVEISEFSR